MRLNAFSLLFTIVFVLTQALVGCSGCSDPDPPDMDIGDATTGDSGDVDPTEAEIICSVRLADGFTIFGPPTDLTLTSADEPAEYLASGGLQFDFRAGTRNIDQGQPVNLFVNGAQVGPPSNVVVTQGSDGLADFANVTLSASGHEIYLEVQTLAGEKLRCEPTVITVEAAVGACDVQLLPTADNCLKEDSDPGQEGIQQTFVVSNPNGECDTARLRYAIGAVELNTNAKALENGEATFTVTIGQTQLDNQEIVVSGVVFKTADPENSVVETAPPTTYIADSLSPEVAITSPINTNLGLGDDADPVAPGLQITMAGVVSGMNPDDDIVIEYDNKEMTVKPAGTEPNFTWQATLDFQNSGTFEVNVSSSDSCGNQGNATIALNVATSASSLTISTPADGSTLASKDDTDTQNTTYETDFIVTATEVVTPVTFTIKCGKNAGGQPKVTVGSAEINELANDNNYSVPVVLDVNSLGSDISCSVSDNALNPGFSEAIQVTLAMPAPLLNILTPSGDSTQNGTTVQVSGAATNLNGKNATISLSSTNGDVYSGMGLTPAISGGGFNWMAYLTDNGAADGNAVADGTYTLSLDATDSFGNAAAEQLQSNASVTVVLDTSAPTLTLTTPTTSVFEPTDDTGFLPGFQVFVTITVDDGGNEAGTVVCLNVNGDDIPCATVPDGQVTAIFNSVTLQPGDNAVIASATDAAGNEAVAIESTLTLNSDAPVIVISAPSQDTSTGLANVDVTISVTDTAGVAQSAATVVLTIDGPAASADPITNLGGGLYQVNNAALGDPGLHTLQATAVIDGGTMGYSAPRYVTYKTGEVSIEVASPQGPSINKASVECTPGLADCATNVTCTTTNVDNGSSAAVTVTCGVNESSVGGLVINDQVTFPGILLPNGSSCTISCQTTDKGTGQEAKSQPLSINVDRTSPSFGGFSKPTPGVLIFSADENKSQPGMQYSMELTVAGLENGQLVTISVIPENGAAFDVETVVSTAIPDNTLTIIYLPQTTLPDGVVTLKASALDLAGNPAENSSGAIGLSKVVQVIGNEPIIRISSPAWTDDTDCSDSSQCDNGFVCVTGVNKCGLGWNANSLQKLYVIASGVPAISSNLRVCSNSADYAANTVCKGEDGAYHEVMTITMTASPKEIDLNSLTEGVHNLIVEGKTSETENKWVSSIDGLQPADQQRLIWKDIVTPIVTSLTSSSDTTIPVGVLNNAEQSKDGGYYLIEVVSDKSGSASLVINGQEGAGQALESVDTSYQTSFEVMLGEGANQVYAKLTDAVGNINSAPPATVVYSPLVDTIAPLCEFVSPNSSPLLVGAGLDVTVQTDGSGLIINLSDKGSDLGSETAAAGGIATFSQAQYPSALADGSHTLAASVNDSAGNNSFCQTNPTVISVDTTPPSVVLTAPAASAALGDADDASASGGFQIDVQFTAGGDTATWEIQLDSGCDATFLNCTGTSTVDVGNGAEAVQTQVTLPVFTSPDFLVLRVVVKDALGNSSSAVSQVSVTLSDCSVALTGLPASKKVGNANCPTAGSDCDSIEMNLNAVMVGACGSVDSVQLKEDGVVVATSAVSNLSASFTRNYDHGDIIFLEAAATSGGTEVATTGSSKYFWDLKDPVPTFAAKDVSGFTTPASGSTQSYNANDDQSLSAPGLQIPLYLTISDSGLGYGNITTLTINDGSGETNLSGTVPVLPIAYSGTLTTQDFTNVTLPEGDGNTVTITVTDLAGNEATSDFIYSGDSVAPDALAVSLTVVNRRRPEVSLSWDEVGSNGSEGINAEYDIRYARTEITAVNFEQACVATNMLNAGALPIPGASGANAEYTITGPDPRGPGYTENGNNCQWTMRGDGGSFWVAARVRDTAGNWSMISDNSIGTTSELGLKHAKIEIVGDKKNALYDKLVSDIGDINNDGFGDFAVGGFFTSGFCIIYGSDQGATVADLQIDPVLAPDGPNHQCILDATSTRLGYPARNIGDVDGDGLQDLGVPAGKPQTEVRIYKGVNGGKISSTPMLTITNYSDSGPFKDFAGGGNFNGDSTDAGNPIGDILVGSRLDDEIFIVPGTENWPQAVLDLSSAADRTAFGVVTVKMTDMPGAGADFGSHVDFVGDILTDSGDGPYDDIIIGASEPISGTQAVIIRGRNTQDLAADTILLVSYDHSQTSDPTFEDASSVRIMSDGTSDSFATECIPRIDVDEDGINDIILGHSKSPIKVIYLFKGSAIQAAEGGTLTLNAGTTPEADECYKSTSGVAWESGVDHIAGIGNFDMEDTGGSGQSLDFAYLKKSASTNGSVFIRLNTDNGANFPAGTYPWTDLELTDPEIPGNLKFGNFDVRGIGDFNGDGMPDIAVGTNGSGRTYIFY
ncbi:MAG TPA: hypothetical protein EYN66_03935 [Myxococcales bacterium]|nr:hypothetical protein [Myxococcales bacterium]